MLIDSELRNVTVDVLSILDLSQVGHKTVIGYRCVFNSYPVVQNGKGI